MSAAGKWNVTLDTPLGNKTGTLDLLVDGSVLSGTLSDGEHVVVISEGRIAGNKLSWSAQTTKPMRMTIKFTATVDTDRIEGTAKHFLGSAPFRGQRA